ncbi:MAG: hypothetical protein J6S02_04315 [Bacteroidaceae bacterium]|nr:hypothetical protein [Bacteroidaceae bacterium]
METYHGLLSLRLCNSDSKSEGTYAVLTLEDGKEYVLYRKDTYPADDTFFTPYDAQHLGVRGVIEAEGNNLLVEALILPDGTEICPPETIIEESKEIIYE